MKEWLTAREIAAERLSSELPTTESGMIRFASDASWNDSIVYCRKRAGRGGGLEYHINLLPTLARIEYERRHRQIARVEPKADPEIILGSNLTDRAARERDARIAILSAFEAFSKGRREAVETLLFMFSSQYNMGSLKVDEWVRDLIPSISKRTMHRWRTAKFVGRVDRLAHDPGKARKGKGLLDVAEGGNVKQYILALIAHQPHIKAERVQTLVSGKFRGALKDAHGDAHPVPSIRTIQQRMAVWRVEETVVLTKLSDPDRHRSIHAVSGVGTLRWVTEPNMLWMIDSSPLDAMDDTIARPTVYACIDIGTRRMVLFVSRTPRASAVALLLRKALLTWGVPQKIKTDNGSDFVAEDTKRLLAALQIEMELSDAYQPQQKAHVERAIKTMQHGLAELLPGYVGHNVAERKRLEDRVGFAKRLGAETADLFGVRYTLAEIQTMADRWVETVYEQTVHSALNGRTPAQVAQASTAVMRTVDVRALDMLLMPVPDGGFRKVTKLGVRLNGFHYATIRALPNDRVFVRCDPADMGLLYLFAEQSGEFIEHAVCPELAGIDPVEFYKMVRAARAAYLKEKTDPIRVEIKSLTTGTPMIELYLAEKARQLPPRENVIQLPQRTADHVTPELAAALTAATGERHEAPVDPVLTEISEEATVIAFVPKPSAGSGRPAFRSDQEMAAWLLANPNAMTEADRRLMSDRLKSWTFRELLSVQGGDADALAALIKSPAKQVQSQ